MEKTWLKHYDPRVSAEIDADRYASVVDIFEQSVKKFKNKEAFKDTSVLDAVCSKILDESDMKMA